MIFGQKAKHFDFGKSISQGEQNGLNFSFIAPSSEEKKDYKE